MFVMLLKRTSMLIKNQCLPTISQFCLCGRVSKQNIVSNISILSPIFLRQVIIVFTAWLSLKLLLKFY